MVETITTLPTLPAREAHGHKGDYGRVLVISGSRGMTGAAVLCGRAALRAGAGLVKVAVPAEVLPIVAAGNPCYTTAALPQDAEGRIAHAAYPALAALCAEHDVIAVGPGLGRSAELTALLTELVATVAAPMVIDADGLNAFIGHVDKLPGRDSPRILTPHPGEFSRLLHLETKKLAMNSEALAIEFASEHNAILVLKGHETLVTDGASIYRNRTGNPGMATGGTGDVLTGIIAALICQGLAPLEAAQLGVHVHGLAGDLARDQIGEVSLIASDLLDFLPPAFRQVAG